MNIISECKFNLGNMAVDLDTLADILKQYNITLRDSQNEFRAMGDILSDVAQQWDIVLTETEFEHVEKSLSKLDNVNVENKLNLKKGALVMNNFGKIESDVVKDSLFGWAFQNQDGNYVYYNSEESRFVVVDDVIFDLEYDLKLCPVFKEKVKVNSVVLYDNEFVFIVEIKSNNYLKGVSYKTGKLHEFTTSMQVDGKGYYQVIKKSHKTNN